MTEENFNKYICSRGILKQTDIHMHNPVSSINKVTNYDFSKCSNGSTIYICLSALRDFITNIFPKLPYKIILITGDCDETCWVDVFKHSDYFLEFIQNERIIHWFAQNCIGSHPKLTPIPIGLDYHTMTTLHKQWGPQLNPFEQELILNTIVAKSKPFWERQLKTYANFHFAMNTKFGYDRMDAYQSVRSNLVYYEPQYSLREESWNKQIMYAFVISPHGNGLDCHRTWEALVLGCIPIVKTSPIDIIYQNLPVLIVKSWSDITEKLLKETISQFKLMTFSYEKLTNKYWFNLINSKKYDL
jgi:hypothetical protein